MVRAFVALELSKEIKDQLAVAQETIRGCSARLTFVDPKNIHITQNFLVMWMKKPSRKLWMHSDQSPFPHFP